MHPLRRLAAALALSGGLLLAGPAHAQVQNGTQLPSPRLMTITPLGAKAGTTVELTFTGTDLEDPTGLLVSHPGIKAEPIIPPLPPPPKVDPKAKAKTPPPPPPQRPPVTKFTVKVGADVPVGAYDVRLVNKWGVSNPRTFVVGDLNEVQEKENNDDFDKAQRIELGSTVNGVISSQVDVDYFVFAGKKGQGVLVHCLCGSIDSRLNPELKLLEAGGREIAKQRPLPGEDGILHVSLPSDGDYYVRLCQFTYQGGNAEYFYRLNLSTGPYVELVYPPMVEPGKPAQVTVYGHNLPGGKLDPTAVVDGRTLEKITVTVDPPKEPDPLRRLRYSGVVPPTRAFVDGFEYRLKTEAGTSNPYLLMLADAPVVVDNEANDTKETAQEISVPCEVAGRIEKRGDHDWYAFTAKKGDVFMIEILSQRLGAPTDLYFRLVKPGPKETYQDIAQGDDSPETLSNQSFFTGSQDPSPYRFVVPADGKYLLLVGSHLGGSLAGVQHMYRLRIAPERPDFRLFVMPTDGFRPGGVVVGKGGDETFGVFVWRRDGFKGEVTLTMDGLPTGVTCKPQIAHPAMKRTSLVVSAAETAPLFTGPITLMGTAVIAGNKVVREARSAAVTWPVPPGNNIPTVTRLDRGAFLAVREKPPYALATKDDKGTVFHGDKLTVALKAKRLWPDAKGQIQIQAVPSEQIPGLNLPQVNIGANATDGNLAVVVPANVPPGTYNIVFHSFLQVPFNKDPMAKQKPNVNAVVSSAPFQLTVLPKSVANLSVDNANPTVKLAKDAVQMVLTVRVARLHDYDGTFKVELVLPPNTKGVSADPVTIPAGQSEAKLTLRVPADAAPGGRPNLTVRAVATINGNVPLTHETKINVNIVK
jgi:hypothetical protein